MIEAQTGHFYRALVTYDGTDYHGWQQQRGVCTVEGVLVEVLESLTGERPRARAAGRTDAGVHAHGQVVSFGLRRSWEPAALRGALNARLPADIAVLEVASVAPEFDPRRGAWRRTYRYLVSPAADRLAIGRQYAWRLRGPLELEPMRAAARLTVGTHDFRSFGTSPRDGASTVRTVERSEVFRNGNLVAIEVRGDAFLRGMLRNLASCLVAVGQRRIEVGVMAALLRGPSLAARAWGLAPAHGLHQWRVDYDWPVVSGAPS